MYQKIFKVIFILLMIFNLSGCTAIGEKNVDLTFIYFSVALISLVFLIICCFLIRQNKLWFITLFSSVFIVNFGYWLLSVSPNLQMALMANRISYLGSVLLPLSMLMIIMKVTNTKISSILIHILLALAVVVFFIAASP